MRPATRVVTGVISGAAWGLPAAAERLNWLLLAGDVMVTTGGSCLMGVAAGGGDVVSTRDATWEVSGRVEGFGSAGFCRPGTAGLPVAIALVTVSGL